MLRFLLILTFFYLSSWPSFAEEPKIDDPLLLNKKAEEITQDIHVKDIVDATNDYSYSSMNKPNPFIPPLVSSLYSYAEIPIVSVLQKYTIETLKVVGIWTLANETRKALIMTAGSEGVIVKLGDAMGRRGGKVVKIDQSKVVVREFSLASDGTRQFEDFVLWLGNDQPKKVEDKITIHSRDPGRATLYGYGSKNYSDDKDYEKKRELLLEKNKQDLIPSVEAPAAQDHEINHVSDPIPSSPTSGASDALGVSTSVEAGGPPKSEVGPPKSAENQASDKELNSMIRKSKSGASPSVENHTTTKSDIDHNASKL